MARRGRRLALALAVGGLEACAGGHPPSLPPPPPPAASASAPAASAPAPTSEPRAAPATTAPSTAAPLPSAPVPASAVARAKTDAGWAACLRDAKGPSKDMAHDLTALGLACEKQTAMKPLGKMLSGKQADRDPPQAYALEAKASHCYRVYARAEETIRNLDVAVKDSAGIILGHDSTENSRPVVPRDGAVCFDKDDAATVVVSVGSGSGAYALQIWGD